MRPAHPAALSMRRRGAAYAVRGRYSIVCTRAVRFPLPACRRPAPCRPSWLKESRARSRCCATHAAVHRRTGRPEHRFPAGRPRSHIEKGFPQAGARRLEKGLLGGKICGGAGEGDGRSAAQGRPQKPQRRLLGRAVHPAYKGRCVGRGKAFFQMGKGCTGRSRCRKKHTKGSFRGQNAARTSFILPEHCWKFCTGCANPA